MLNINEVYELLSKLTPEQIEAVKSYLSTTIHFDMEETLTNIKFSLLVEFVHIAIKLTLLEMDIVQLMECRNITAKTAIKAL